MGQCLSCTLNEGNSEEVEVLECLWFPDTQMPCRNYASRGACSRRNCTYAHIPTSLSRFLKYFEKTKSTLEIAVYTITCNEIAEAVNNCHRRGVKVRIITDDQQINSTGSDIKSLHAKGIPVRHDGSQQYHMHHKFAVFDCALVATGSFNWTRQAVLHNQENIVVLKGADVAKQYQSEFDKMW
eukprot:CAMPEP_0117654954 /NCGR_PEP_ID=MMETSP0804-20121206/4023_1 /TAXON_ID=1074897 /ORGANISM="Tetraselmis astigmatica, Strain CCMP880" /LENGTH=182 /DNA_ID=CAMNT_0005461277 /DNA_START=237 /DNA_END=782 /DNA_ORIENTATION=+